MIRPDVGPAEVLLRVSPLALELALNCLDACSQDEREPQRYRDWYAEAAAELRASATLIDPD